MNAAKAKNTYPDNTFEVHARTAGADVLCLWQQRGPKDTAVEWIECLLVNGTLAMVQTYKEGGWEVFTTCGSIDVSATISDALLRCRVLQADGKATA